MHRDGDRLGQHFAETAAADALGLGPTFDLEPDGQVVHRHRLVDRGDVCRSSFVVPAAEDSTRCRDCRHEQTEGVVHLAGDLAGQFVIDFRHGHLNLEVTATEGVGRVAC